MFQQTLHFHLIGLPEEHVEALRNIAPREETIHVFDTELPGEARAQTLRDRDIVIIAEAGAALAASVTCVRPWLVTTGVPALGAAELERFEGVWPAPDAATLRFHVERLLERLERERGLALHDIYLRTLLRTTSAMVWFKDLDGLHDLVSDVFLDISGRSAEEVRGSGHAFVWGMSEEEYATSPVACRESDRLTVEGGGIYRCDEMVQVRGELRPFATVKNVLRDCDGTIIGTMGVANDITRMTMLGAEIEILIDNLPFAVLIADSDNRVLRVNGRFEDLFYEAEPIVPGKSAYTPGEDRRCTRGDVLRNELKAMNPSPVTRRPPQWFTGDDSTWVEVQNIAISTNQGASIGTIVLFHDVTEEKHVQDGLVRDAFEDTLTGMFNRRHFYQNTHPEANSGLIFLDLDHFKRLNDMFGHKAGDECLRAAGRLLMDIDPHFARLGGDEFVLYESATTLAELEAKANRISSYLTAGLRTRFGYVVPSIGVYFTTELPRNIDDIMNRVDAAMYVNKYERAELHKLQRLLAKRRDKLPLYEIEILRRAIVEQEAKSGPYTVYTEGMERLVSAQKKRHARRAQGSRDDD